MSTTVSGQTPEPQPKPLVKAGKRLEIKERMSVEEVQKNGNAAQKAAATIFDINGDGSYDYDEAYAFNNTRITADTNTGEIRLYKKDAPRNAKPTETVNIEAEKVDYAKRTAKYQKFAQTLKTFGLSVENAEWVGINDCKLKTINGKQHLVLIATPTDKKSHIQGHFELTLPIDKDFDPSQIEMYRSEGPVCFKNIRGTFKLLGDETREHNYSFGGNSDVTVICKDGEADEIEIEDNAKVTIKTKDYADTLLDRTRKGEESYNHDFKHLKPGTTTVKGAGNSEKKE